MMEEQFIQKIPWEQCIEMAMLRRRMLERKYRVLGIFGSNVNDNSLATDDESMRVG
jgi:ethanolamine utilization microcompartment shell protein EutL